MASLRWTSCVFGIMSIAVVSVWSINIFDDDFADLRGPYCVNRGCCPGRQDDCSIPIVVTGNDDTLFSDKGTLCYCDDFCNRTRNEDCCPDFWGHCRGVTPPPGPSPVIGVCEHRGSVYGLGKVLKINCNACKCERVGEAAKFLCEENDCLLEPKITDNINSYRHGWSASNYSEFWGRTLEEGIKLRLGTLQPDRFVMRMNPVRRIYDPHSLPREFESANEWPDFISGIQDQGWCGSSWAISTAAVASDRFAILSKGLEKVQLSPQNLLSCDRRGQQSCNGGYLDRAWSYIRKFGLVDEKCFPYSASNENCRIPRRGNLITARCEMPQIVDRKSMYRVAPAYRLGNETDVMFEILKSGPVQATMKVYHDFFTYRNGIYKHTELSASQRTGYHSVRIVGWGEEYTQNGIQKYWKVANSWGREWGEDGYFRIVRGTNECDIEAFVLATWPEIENKLLLGNEI